jgi:fructose-1,6-bisphosphatase II / sedoheptulose-1,7-bisphosphatase
VGRGDEKAADQAAVDAMRLTLNSLALAGTVVIGEGERDEAPMLACGEKVGAGGQPFDIALDPLEGTGVTARGLGNALSVIALTEPGGFLCAPDVYMNKIAVGPDVPDGIIDIDATPAENIAALAKIRQVSAADIQVCILDRPRHEQLIADVRRTGARIHLIGDGDVAGVIATATPDSGIDLYMGTGGAPEGVLAAAALACLGGQIQGRLIFRNDVERARAQTAGITNLDRKYLLRDMACGPVMFAATGVTDGPMLKGVRHHGGRAETHSLVMRSQTGTIRYITSHHDLRRKPVYELRD